MNLHEYVLLASSSLFVIIDPIATVPAFLAMTPNDSPQDRIRMARMACVIAAIILLIFATTGKLIFNFFGITIPAFQIAGSIVLLLVALDMLRARRRAGRHYHRRAVAQPGGWKSHVASRALRLHRGRLPGELPDLRPFGPRRKMVEPDLSPAHEPPHGPAAGGDRHAIPYQGAHGSKTGRSPGRNDAVRPRH